jgi:hypothetical protein
VNTSGPGVTIYADGDTPGTWIARPGNGPIAPMTARDIAAQPIHHQWFAGTKNGLIATWPTRAMADDHHRAYGVIVGQLMPTLIGADDIGQRYVILVDANGLPLTAGNGPQ